jgi:putative transcription factor
MECEVCGKSIWKPFLVKIEGAEMKVCKTCSRFGSKKEKGKGSPEEKKFTPSKKLSDTKPKKTPELIEDYSRVIMDARETMDLSREKLGEKISVKASVIARLESGRMSPDEKLIKKLDRALGIKLLEETKEEPMPLSNKAKEELTIGDIIKIKKKG